MAGGKFICTSNSYNPSTYASFVDDNNNKSGGSAKGEFAHGKVDPVEAGKKGGKASGSSSNKNDNDNNDNNDSNNSGGDYKPKEHDGLRKDGQPDGRVKGN